MNAASPPRPTPQGAVNVSDHALVRWLERNNIVDIQQLRNNLASSLGAACGAADQIRVSEYAIRRNGWKYIIRDHTLITMFPAKDGAVRRPKRWHQEDCL